VQGGPVKVSPADAAALQATGHEQLAAGRYPQAIGSLLAAIRASGQSLPACMQPTTDACLTFAYALYDLGRALRLDGNPSAAVPVLRERLRIDNQRPVVEQELQLAKGGTV
jgi:tetratricopeptide (TPR) repeat protein